MKTLSDVSVSGRSIILRVDINVPLEKGSIQDDSRIREVLPTIQYLLGKGPKRITMLAHQGDGKEPASEITLRPHAERLEELLRHPVTFSDGWNEVALKPGSKILLLENLRLSDEKHKNVSRRESFARLLATFGDLYVNDAFAVCHRDHASVSVLPGLIKESVAGILLVKELSALSPLIRHPEQPLTLILGGAKLETKLPLIRNFVGKAKYFLLGGGIANSFLHAKGYDVGLSLCEREKAEELREMMLSAQSEEETLITPLDVIVADDLEPEFPQTLQVPVQDVSGAMRILDIGTRTVDQYITTIRKSRTIIWNGPLGYFEHPLFRDGSLAIARALSESPAKVIIGGGDTIAVLNKAGLSFDQFHHVSTGGGAMLEYLSGKELPGLKALSV